MKKTHLLSSNDLDRLRERRSRYCGLRDERLFGDLPRFAGDLKDTTPTMNILLPLSSQVSLTWSTIAIRSSTSWTCCDVDLLRLLVHLHHRRVPSRCVLRHRASPPMFCGDRASVPSKIDADRVPPSDDCSDFRCRSSRTIASDGCGRRAVTIGADWPAWPLPVPYDVPFRA